MLGFIISLIVVGAIAGFIARLLVRNDGVSGIIPTIVLGMIGSFVGGFLGNLLAGNGFQFTTSGLIGSIIGSVIALLVYRSMGNRSTASA